MPIGIDIMDMGYSKKFSKSLRISDDGCKYSNLFVADTADKKIKNGPPALLQ